MSQAAEQAATPPAAVDLTAAARKVLAADRERRAAACEAAINAVLRRYGCQLDAEPVPVGGGAWRYQVVVHARDLPEPE